jgi:hypothetical protein
MTDLTPEQIEINKANAAQKKADEKANADKIKADAKIAKDAKKAEDKLAADQKKAEAKEAKTKATAEKAEKKTADTKAKADAKEKLKADRENAKAAKIKEKADAVIAKEANRPPTVNGIRRPKAGTKTGDVWAICDTLREVLERAPKSAEVVVEGAKKELNKNTCHTQYVHWRTHNGIEAQGGVKKAVEPKESKGAPTGTPEQAAAVTEKAKAPEKV